MYDRGSTKNANSKMKFTMLFAIPRLLAAAGVMLINVCLQNLM